jgi:hypothetical protein
MAARLLSGGHCVPDSPDPFPAVGLALLGMTMWRSAR